jgi:succinate dehydrogenase/fumarate reductase iron-sulfur protein
MKKKTIILSLYNPDTASLDTREYCVALQPGATVLQALQYIYEELDPRMAFRYGCRYKRCGLCGVMVDGKPRLACKVKLDRVREIAPLSRLPLLRGLVVNRAAYMDSLKGLHFFPQGKEIEPLGQLMEDPLHQNLMNCMECLCCVATCPRETVDNQPVFGPYAFVKLAQLHLDPRDATDRAEQARSLGIDDCNNCHKCTCPNGIHLHKALLVLQNR